MKGLSFELRFKNKDNGKIKLNTIINYKGVKHEYPICVDDMEDSKIDLYDDWLKKSLKMDYGKKKGKKIYNNLMKTFI